MKISCQFQQPEKLKKYKQIPKEVESELKKLIAVATTNTSLDAQRAAPVNTGRLARSIRKYVKGLTGEIIADTRKGMIGAGTNYAAYVEFGTGDKVRYPNELADYASQFKGKGFHGRLPVNIYGVGWRMIQFPVSNYARPYLFPAFDWNRKKFIKECDRILKRAI